MSVANSLARHQKLIDLLKGKYLSFEALTQKLAYASEIDDIDYNMSLRTFHRERANILSVYKLEIVYDKAHRGYTIYEEDMLEEKMDALNAYRTYQAISQGEVLSKNFEIERRQAKGLEHIMVIIKAIQKKKALDFDYGKFSTEASTHKTVSPYAVKEFDNRWYMIGKDHQLDKVRVYGFDRIENVYLSNQRYRKEEHFDLKEMFQHSFGVIILEDESPQELRFWVDHEQAKYLISKPIHHSQKILTENVDGGMEMSCHLYITYDLMMELRSYGPRIRIISPQSLRERIKEELLQALSYYK